MVARLLRQCCAGAFLLVLVPDAIRGAEPEPLRAEAATALRRGVQFFRERVAVNGTYLWQYSEDLTKREGEGKASATLGWVQPPGTPAVGTAFLRAHEATGDSYHLDAARETALGLVSGQLWSGGWTYSIAFDPAERKKTAYRDGGGRSGRNTTTLDDDTTQSAVRFLMGVDTALKFEHAAIHRCLLDALESLLKAQYPNGAWPQGYDEFPDPSKFPVKEASYPDVWSRTWPGSQQYWRRYTLNDNSLATMIETMFETARVYGAASATTNLASKCHAAALRAGEFLIRAQMPEPQPAWAQQYDFDMHPAWARKFEPPSISGGESQSALETLLLLYQETGDRKYLQPIPRALDYLRRSRLSDGRLARFYELRSNKPLYFTKEYELTHDDSNMPTHYAFKVSDRTDSIARDYARLATNNAPTVKQPAKVTPKLESDVKRIVAAQDAQGRWVEAGRLRHHGASQNEPVIRSETLIRNVEILSRYLSASGR